MPPAVSLATSQNCSSAILLAGPGARFCQCKTTFAPVTSTQKRAAVRVFCLVTQVGQNWNQLVAELAGWHALGKDFATAQS
jgi:hypothetical protein